MTSTDEPGPMTVGRVEVESKNARGVASAAAGFEPDDAAALAQAFALLTAASLAMQITDLVGTPIERMLDRLPKSAGRRIHAAAESALRKAVGVALSSMRDAPARPASTRLHKAAAAATGAAGGFFGWAGMLVEIPAITMLMVRSIADVARAEGFSITDAEVRRDCVMVFALDGGGHPHAGADIGYFAIRDTLEGAERASDTQPFTDAARRIAKRAIVANETAPLLTKWIEAAAARLGVAFTEKAAAQWMPVVGAAGGATLNTLFTAHFQNMARGHFTIRRLEGKYGKDAVRRQFHDLAAARRGVAATTPRP
ncbi:MAG: EcsC family protein [Lysobacteraceae bacterium]|nr:MAG: EcsC family protein [Xanthomonadaceae bacterium]